jgi:hypothetical protein
MSGCRILQSDGSRALALVLANLEGLLGYDASLALDEGFYHVADGDDADQFAVLL